MSLPRPHQLVVCLILGLSMLTLLHCGGDEKQQPRTYNEYASLVCGEETPSIPIGVTWGESREYLKARIRTLEHVIPPDEVADYHFANLAVQNTLLEAAEDKDSNAMANYYEVINHPDFATFARVLADAEEELSAEVWLALYDHGCPVG